jgi:hypothetical protein
VLKVEFKKLKLQGSEKQIAWAKQARDLFIQKVLAWDVDGDLSDIPQEKRDIIIPALVRGAGKTTDASFWLNFLVDQGESRLPWEGKLKVLKDRPMKSIWHLDYNRVLLPLLKAGKEE